MGRRATRCFFLAVALFGLDGCLASQDRGLAASWYLVDKDSRQSVPGNEPGTGEVAAEVDDIFLALVNRGPKAKQLYALFMNGQELASFTPWLRLSDPYVIAPGQVLILPTGIFTSQEPPCRLPVSLTVRTTAKKRQRPRPIRLIGTMPGALPSEWLEKCRR